MNLRTLKKLSKRAAPLLPLLGDDRKQFPAERWDNYTGLLIMDRKAASVQTGVVINHSEHYYRQYVDHYVNLCPWRPELCRKPNGQIYSTYLDFSCRQPDFLKSAFFNEWARPQGIHHGMLGTVYQDPDCTVQLLIQRTAGPGHFTAEETRAMNTLVPHLQHVCTLRRLYEDGQRRSGAISASAERLGAPFLLFDEREQLIYSSPQAEHLIQRSPLMQRYGERLALKVPTLHQRLRAAITSARKTAAGRSHRPGERLVLRCPVAGELYLTVMPVWGDDAPLLFTPRRAFVALCLEPVNPPVALSHGALRDLFGLTPKESDVAERLARGQDIQTIARETGTRDSTVRCHLKHLFGKVGVRSQSALVSRLLGSPARRRPL